jgi:Flp pilus assembly protein TadD
MSCIFADQYDKAIPYLQKAVELNPLEHPVWIRLGYAALEVENWELATKAYIHANNLDDEVSTHKLYYTNFYLI